MFWGFRIILEHSAQYSERFSNQHNGKRCTEIPIQHKTDAFEGSFGNVDMAHTQCVSHVLQYVSQLSPIGKADCTHTAHLFNFGALHSVQLQWAHTHTHTHIVSVHCTHTHVVSHLPASHTADLPHWPGLSPHSDGGAR